MVNRNVITVLGSTGSIGQNTLAVIDGCQGRYKIYALTADHNVDRLFQQCLAVKPLVAVMVDPSAAGELRTRLQRVNSDVQVLSGAEELIAVATEPEVDTVMAGIVGAAGLLPTMAAARAGKRLLLANKEALVMAGELLMREVLAAKAELIPVDSEHSAIFQCMPGGYSPGSLPKCVNRIIITASGGPFLKVPLDDLHHVTPEQACLHPNWSMGRKISVDSATMVNKALEVIEAVYLFGISRERLTETIQVVCHPESIIHSMVGYVDGSIIAQLGNHDMKIPIAYALAWPDRLDTGAKHVDFTDLGSLEFRAISRERYPGFFLCYKALDLGQAGPIVMNAANEIAVEAFLNQRIRFTEIAVLVESILQVTESESVDSLDDVLRIDKGARLRACEWVDEWVETTIQ